jgi:predicted ABC-type ATPase
VYAEHRRLRDTGVPVLSAPAPGPPNLAVRVPGARTHLAFVNADLIAERLWPGDRGEQARRAAEVSQLAAEERARLMAQQVSFITETVFSHPSKLDLLRQALLIGYTVSVHIVMVPEELAVERVADRVRCGGHSVPEDKIRGRYGRLWELVARRATWRTGRTSTTTPASTSRSDASRSTSTGNRSGCPTGRLDPGSLDLTSLVGPAAPKHRLDVGLDLHLRHRCSGTRSRHPSWNQQTSVSGIATAT